MATRLVPTTLKDGMTPFPALERTRSFLARQPIYWREAALCAPAMPLILLAGVAIHNLPYAAVATGAAFSVGFGAARALGGWRWGAMTAACLGATLAAFVGCLAGEEPVVLMVLVGAAAIANAVLALAHEGFWWLSLRMVVALLVAGYFHGPPHAALLRAGAVLAGGALQIAIVMTLAWLAPAAARKLPAAAARPPSRRAVYVGHAIRAAVCVCGSLWIATALGLANGYWAPMTALIVLKPGLSETGTRGLARVGGTLIGGALATGFAVLAGYAWPPLVVGLGAAATASFALQKAHYAIFTSAVTATVVLLLSLAEAGHALANAEHRLIATLIGGALALAVARILPHTPATANPTPDQIGGV
ncbi:MAG TPA: FUSC family protein [Caulobacteraceae bacterium]|nr:FUSC family protein [Caulobacteraceae bacterium]